MLHYEDRVKFTLIAGSGGQGSLSFHRSRKKARGGPDGGDGGKGGDIGFFSDSRYRDFSHFKRKSIFRAENGGNGSEQLKSGRKGKDLLIPLPPGVLLKDEKGNLLKDLFHSENPFLFLKGGIGGKGNVFYKSSVNQAPAQFQKGQVGEKKQVVLELKPLVDVALVGRVNIGKSTFFNKVTGGKSPVGNYACTTLAPYYGWTKTDSPCSLMDIPGIPEKVCEKNNKNLSFLRLMGRAKVLLIFVSVEPGVPSPAETLRNIEEDLKTFDKKYPEKEFAFSHKKRIVVLSKIDLLKEPTLKQEMEALASEIKNLSSFENKKKPLDFFKESPLAINEMAVESAIKKGNTNNILKQGKFFTLSSKTGKGVQELLNIIHWNLTNEGNTIKRG